MQSIPAAPQQAVSRPPVTFEPSPALQSGLRLLIAHQDVGDDVLRGAMEASRLALPRPLSVIPLASRAPLPPGVWAHVRIGQDGDPASKLAHLEELVSGGYADSVDAILFKLSSSDVLPGTDPVQLRDALCATFERIRAGRALRLVPATVPLQARPRGLVARLMRALGSSSWVARANAVRAELNTLLRGAFEGQPLFDLAALESRGAAFLGEPALHPALTHDGSRLNAAGRVALGSALLSFAATLPTRSAT